MQFLPTDYKSPKISDKYMKLQDGENKIRILSKPILGWEEWDDKTPIRYMFDDKPAFAIDPKRPPRHFWSMIVWNYADQKIQILHIIQASIRNKIEKLANDSDWGAPYFYDIKITKSGQGKDTDYGVNPLPHKPVTPAIKQAFYDKRCNLEALFKCQDPFAPNQKYTDGIFDEETQAEHFTSPIEALQEALSIEGVNSEHLGNYLEFIAKSKNITSEEAAKFGAALPASSFKDAYKKYVSKNFAKESLQPA